MHPTKKFSKNMQQCFSYDKPGGVILMLRRCRGTIFSSGFDVNGGVGSNTIEVIIGISVRGLPMDVPPSRMNDGFVVK